MPVHNFPDDYSWYSVLVWPRPDSSENYKNSTRPTKGQPIVRTSCRIGLPDLGNNLSTQDRLGLVLSTYSVVDIWGSPSRHLNSCIVLPILALLQNWTRASVYFLLELQAFPCELMRKLTLPCQTYILFMRT